MTRQTTLIRILMVLLLGVLLLACGVLYLMSLESARMWPEYAHLRLPVYVGVLIGLVPVVMAFKFLFDFMGLVDRGDAFSSRTMRILRRLRLLIGIFAGYFVLGLVAFRVTFDQLQPGLVLGWFVMEVTAVFLFTVVALLERLFGAALELRQDHELAV